MTKKLFEIVLVLLGLITGSLATIRTSIVPTQVSVVSNQDVKIQIDNGGQPLTSVKMTGGSFLPIHEEKGKFYFSPTLDMNDLVSDSRVNENYAMMNRAIYIDNDIDNCYLQAELVIEGDDELNNAIRVMINDQYKKYYLSKENPVVLCDGKMLTSKNRSSTSFYLWYELSDESITIDNINNGQGAEVTINLYAYVKE